MIALSSIAGGVLFLTLGVAASNDDCSQQLRPNIEAEVVAAQTLEYRDAIARGYTLPPKFINGYYSRRIEPYLSKKIYEEVKNPTVLYRGAYLTAEELAHILKHGFEVSKASWFAVGGKGIYYTTSKQEAVSYIFQSDSGRKKGIGVVVAVKKQPSMMLVHDPKSNPTNTIYKIEGDSPASDIVGVAVWGRWGLEDLRDIIAKALVGQVIPHEQWTGGFDNLFSR